MSRISSSLGPTWRWTKLSSSEMNAGVRRVDRAPPDVRTVVAMAVLTTGERLVGDRHDRRERLNRRDRGRSGDPEYDGEGLATGARCWSPACRMELARPLPEAAAREYSPRTSCLWQARRSGCWGGSTCQWAHRAKG